MSTENIQKVTLLDINADPAFSHHSTLREVAENYPEADAAAIRITYPDRVVVVRGDLGQTLPEYIMSLLERAGERIEVTPK